MKKKANIYDADDVELQQTAEFHPGGTGCPCGTQGGGFGHEAGKGEKESA